jgi:hypothetical protein
MAGETIDSGEIVLRPTPAVVGTSVPTATLDSRYSFTIPFLRGAALFAQDAARIERSTHADLDSPDVARHKSCVASAIMQSSAALESELWEVCVHGPGHHLGSNGIDHAAREYLKPLTELIDGESVLDRYDLVLHLLRKPRFDHSLRYWQDTFLLIKLRNIIVHYKSKWGQQLDGEQVIQALARLGHPRPPFFPAAGVNFFPHLCLSAACAAWGVDTAVAFLDEFYKHLGVQSPLEDRSALSPRL